MGPENLDILLCLVAGHLVGDFLLQTDLVARQKKHLDVLFIHVSIVTAVSYLVCGAWLSWQVVVGVFASHLVIDGAKAFSGKDGPKVFLLDQGVHLVALALIGGYWISADVVPWWQAVFPLYTKGVLLLAGAILCVQAGGFWVGKSVAPLQAAIASLPESLPNAGTLIGKLERALIFLLVVAGEPQGVGFLVAAKSILRFGEVKEANQRKEAEYIIIGTLMSFGWALLISFATKKLLAQL